MSNFKNLGKLDYKSNISHFHIPIESVPQDVSIQSEFIVFREDEQFHIYNRKCDHAGGKLCLIDNTIKCPMHDWEFNAKNGKYTNVEVSKKELDFDIIDNHIVIEVNNEIPKLPSRKEQLNVKVTFLSHACLLVEMDGVSFVTDPWIIGFAFSGGWWPKTLPPANWKSIINSVDFIYISHNHPDHLNIFTLEHVRNDMTFFVPNFISQGVSKILERNGFNDIFTAEFNNHYQYKNTDLFLTIFKSGDFRDDSGLYFTFGDFSFLSVVDSNDLNFRKFPQDITLFASSFAGGASGYPLCFDTVQDLDKDKILHRNKQAIKAMIRQNITRCNGKFFLPYAGFFTEGAKRDSYILSRNIKNTIEDLKELPKSTTLLNVNKVDSYMFIGQDIHSSQCIPRDKSFPYTPELLMNQVFSESVYDEARLRTYFEKCNFQKELVLYLSLTNDDFTETKYFIIVDFRELNTQVNFKKFDWKLVKRSASAEGVSISFNSLHVKVRQDAFLWVVYNQMPWEDLSIGFQCRIDRVPDIYNVEFWHHFTNIYV
jgi:CMP-N-acetylneuraminate monooxygenase